MPLTKGGLCLYYFAFGMVHERDLWNICFGKFSYIIFNFYAFWLQSFTVSTNKKWCKVIVQQTMYVLDDNIKVLYTINIYKLYKVCLDNFFQRQTKKPM